MTLVTLRRRGLGIGAAGLGACVLSMAVLSGQDDPLVNLALGLTLLPEEKRDLVAILRVL